MKKTRIIFVLSAIAMSVFLLCSCARGTFRRGEDASRRMVRRGENFIDSGINAVENGVENGENTMIGGMYGANSGYSAGSAIGAGGTTYTNEGTATEISPTLRSRARRMSDDRRRTDDKKNMGEINSNDGNADKGLGSNNNDRK